MCVALWSTDIAVSVVLDGSPNIYSFWLRFFLFFLVFGIHRHVTQIFADM